MKRRLLRVEKERRQAEDARKQKEKGGKTRSRLALHGWRGPMMQIVRGGTEVRTVRELKWLEEMEWGVGVLSPAKLGLCVCRAVWAWHDLRKRQEMFPCFHPG